MLLKTMMGLGPATVWLVVSTVRIPVGPRNFSVCLHQACLRGFSPVTLVSHTVQKYGCLGQLETELPICVRVRMNSVCVLS